MNKHSNTWLIIAETARFVALLILLMGIFSFITIILL